MTDPNPTRGQPLASDEQPIGDPVEKVLAVTASALDQIADEYEASGAVVVPVTMLAAHLRRVAEGLRSPTPTDQETPSS